MLFPKRGRYHHLTARFNLKVEYRFGTWRHAEGVYIVIVRDLPKRRHRNFPRFLEVGPYIVEKRISELREPTHSKI